MRGAVIAELNRQKTHCPNGHPYSEDNTYLTPIGGRRCKTCARDAKKRWRSRNLAAQQKLDRENGRRRYRENGPAIRMRQRLQKYGLTLEQFEAMLITQAGRCGVCGDPLENREHIDHCHGTGEVRGLLCQRCNLLVGHAKDDPIVLLRAASYLEAA